MIFAPPPPPDAQRTWPPTPVMFTLANGLRVLFVERKESPLTELRFVCGGGFGVDPPEHSGCAGFAMAMFGESAQRAGLLPPGAALAGRVTPDAAIVAISSLAHNLEQALMVLARILSDPAFETEEFESVRAQRLALIARERRNPLDLAIRILPPMLYPAGHPCARPFSGSGTESAIAALTPGRLREWYAAHLSPRHGTLIVAGAPSIEKLVFMLNGTIGCWRAADGDAVASGLRQTEPLPDSAYAPSPILLADRPGHSQAGLFAGLLTRPRAAADADALIAAEAILAGMFTSRLNLELREHQAWSYGVRSVLLDARSRGWWLISSFVGEEHAAHAMDYMERELERLAGSDPCSAAELTRAVNYLIAHAHSNYETCAQSADALAQLVVHGLSSSYHSELSNRLRRLEVSDITRTFRQLLQTQAPRWLITGPATALRAALSAAGRGEVTLTRC